MVGCVWAATTKMAAEMLAAAPRLRHLLAAPAHGQGCDADVTAAALPTGITGRNTGISLRKPAYSTHYSGFVAPVWNRLSC